MILIGKNEEERAESRVPGRSTGAGLETPGIRTMRTQRALDDGQL